MTVGSQSLKLVKTLLVEQCGFKDELLEPNFVCLGSEALAEEKVPGTNGTAGMVVRGYVRRRRSVRLGIGGGVWS